MDADTQKLLDDAQRLINELKWKNVASTRIPYVKMLIKELRITTDNFESALTPEMLTQYREQIIVLLNWFLDEEKKYPDAPWLFTHGASRVIGIAHNRYNELLYLLAKKYYGKSVINWIDEKASNYLQTKEAIEQEYEFDDEELRSLRRALDIGE